jgi:hypothetical protein
MDEMGWRCSLRSAVDDVDVQYFGLCTLDRFHWGVRLTGQSVHLTWVDSGYYGREELNMRWRVKFDDRGSVWPHLIRYEFVQGAYLDNRHTRGTPPGGALKGFECALPLWLPFLVIVIPTVFLFWSDRRIRFGRCQRCRYDLSGNMSGACPECGTPINSLSEASAARE